MAWIIALFGKLNSAKTITAIAVFFALSNLLLHSQYDFLLANHLRLYEIVYVFTYSFISLLFMLIGVCFYNFYRKHWSRGTFLASIAVLLLAFILAYINGPSQEHIVVYSVNYLAALVVFAVVYRIQGMLKPNRALNFLGDISYPLYVLHGVNGYILLSVLDGFSINPYISLIITFTVIIAITYLLHRFVEEPSNMFGKRLARWFGTTASFKMR